MMNLQFIKSREQMADELHCLWNNHPLYKFIHGAQYIRKRELEICACIPNYKGERDLFIDLARMDWLMKQPVEKKKPRR